MPGPLELNNTKNDHKTPGAPGGIFTGIFITDEYCKKKSPCTIPMCKKIHVQAAYKTTSATNC